MSWGVLPKARKKPRLLWRMASETARRAALVVSRPWTSTPMPISVMQRMRVIAVSVLNASILVSFSTSFYTICGHRPALKEPGMSAATEAETRAAQDRGALARRVMRPFEHWQLGTEAQAALLGIAASNRAALARYRRGEPIGTSRDQYERVGDL